MGVRRRLAHLARRTGQRVANRVDRVRLAGAAWDLAIFYEFKPPPHGGGNQFMWALRREFERRGLQVGLHAISRVTRACLFNSHQFDFDRIRVMRRDGCRIVHRVDGPLKLYRGHDDGTDRRLWDLNAELADATVFQSRFSLEKSRELGMAIKNPHIIHNTVDRAIFHPPDEAPRLAGRRVRLIATSWSANPNKGSATYQWMDENLGWDRYEMTFVGRSPVTFKEIRMIEPQPSERVAALLRQHDIFVTASLNDPCSNSLLEALACGLPVLHINSGGHGELVGKAGLGFDDVQEIPGRLEALVRGHAEHRAAIRLPTIGEVADRYLEVMGLL